MAARNFKPVKTGVIGLGRFGRLHALTLARLAEAELVGVVARRQESLAALSKELPDVPGWTNLTQAIEESDAEAWVVACTTQSHVTVAREAARTRQSGAVGKADCRESGRSEKPCSAGEARFQ